MPSRNMVNAGVDGVEFITANRFAGDKQSARKAQSAARANVTRAWARAESGSAAGRARETASASWRRSTAPTCLHHRRHGRRHRHGAAPAFRSSPKSAASSPSRSSPSHSPFEAAGGCRSRSRASRTGQSLRLADHHPERKLITVLGRDATMMQAFRAPTKCCSAPAGIAPDRASRPDQRRLRPTCAPSCPRWAWR